MILSLKRLSHLFLATLLLSLGCYDGCSCDSDSDLIGLIAVGKPTFSTARGTNYDVTMHSSTPGATIKRRVKCSYSDR